MERNIHYQSRQNSPYTMSGSTQRPAPPEQAAPDTDCRCTGDTRTEAASRALPLWSRPAMRAVADGIFRPGGLTLTDRIAELTGVLPGWKIADIGCGQGASVLRLRQRYGAHAVGMDASFAQILDGTNATPQASPLPLVTGSAAHPPFRSGTFRMVLCECVLSLLPDTRAALRSFRDLLAPGGILAVTDLYLRGDHDRSSDDMSPSPDSCLGWAATRRDIAAHLHATGFMLRRFEDHSGLLGELAAKLIFAGESPCLLSPVSRTAPSRKNTDNAPIRDAGSLPADTEHTGDDGPPAESGIGHHARSRGSTGRTMTPGYFLLLADKTT